MRRAIAGAALAVGLAWSAGARAQLAPPMQPQQPQQAPPIWNPFLPAQPQQPAPYGQYQGQSTTQQRLDQSETADSGRGLELGWVALDAGPALASLNALGGKNGGSSDGGLAGAFGLSGGARFVTFTLGARLDAVTTGDFTFFAAGIEAGYHIPIGRWDPFFALRGSYLFGSLSGLPAGIDDHFHGFGVGLAAGDDYYLTSAFSIGSEIGANVLFVSPSEGSSATGIDGALRLRIGLHFDL